MVNKYGLTSNQTLKSKRLEDDFEEMRSGMLNAQEQLIERERQLDKLRRRSEAAELALTEAKINFDLERQVWQSEVQHRIDEERIRWQEELSRAESPVTSYRGLTAEYQGLQNLQARRTSARSITNEQIMERHVSRKSSVQPVRSSGQGTPQREDLASSFMSGGALDTPSFHPEHDEYFENATSPPSPHDMAQDILSVSTVGAGPSVQLVERMSAAVRRLECEKVSTREELARLSEQRDQARAQVIALMQHFEARKDLDRRVQRLKEENEKINARYQTTLEMLGEKSELVEELRADVQDVKDMYRELVERTVR
jgi:TATA element modulatory factor